MPVTYDNSVASIQTLTAETVVTFTVAANACLIVGVACSVTTRSVSSMAANGTPLTRLGYVLQNGVGNSLDVFVLTAAPSGVVSLSAQMVGGLASNLYLMAASYVGAKEANPFGIVTGTASSVVVVNVSISTSSTDRVVFFSSDWDSFEIKNATTRQYGAEHGVGGFADTAGSGATFSLSMSCNVTFAAGAFMGINIAFSAAGAVTLPFTFCLLGVGA